MIELKQLTKRFIKKEGELAVLEDLSFKVEPNEFVSIVGPSGCGKTTLLKIIAGLEKSSLGEIFIAGEQINGPGLDRGVVFQESPLFPWKTVSENIELALRIRGIEKEKINSLAEEYLRKINLLEFANFYPKELSGGMKQRAALARTLALDPKILLMDEPFANLDAQTRILMQEELLEIWQNYRKTVLYVTHNIEEAIFLSDRIVVLSLGPARIKEIFNITLARPRTDKTRASQEFNELKFKIWETIKEEILK